MGKITDGIKEVIAAMRLLNNLLTNLNYDMNKGPAWPPSEVAANKTDDLPVPELIVLSELDRKRQIEKFLKPWRVQLTAEERKAYREVAQRRFDYHAPWEWSSLNRPSGYVEKPGEAAFRDEIKSISSEAEEVNKKIIKVAEEAAFRDEIKSIYRGVKRGEDIWGAVSNLEKTLYYNYGEGWSLVSIDTRRYAAWALTHYYADKERWDKVRELLELNKQYRDGVDVSSLCREARFNTAMILHEIAEKKDISPVVDSLKNVIREYYNHMDKPATPGGYPNLSSGLGSGYDIAMRSARLASRGTTSKGGGMTGYPSRWDVSAPTGYPTKGELNPRPLKPFWAEDRNPWRSSHGLMQRPIDRESNPAESYFSFRGSTRRNVSAEALAAARSDAPDKPSASGFGILQNSMYGFPINPLALWDTDLITDDKDEPEEEIRRTPAGALVVHYLNQGTPERTMELLDHIKEKARRDAAEAVYIYGYENIPERERPRITIRSALILRDFEWIAEMGEEAVPILYEYLKDRASEVRQNAALVLMDYDWTGVSENIPEEKRLDIMIRANLTAVLRITDEFKENMVKMGEKAVLILEELLDDDIFGVRHNAAETLCHLAKSGVDISYAVPKLERINAEPGEVHDFGFKAAVTLTCHYVRNGKMDKVHEMIEDINNSVGAYSSLISILMETLGELSDMGLDMSDMAYEFLKFIEARGGGDRAENAALKMINEMSWKAIADALRKEIASEDYAEVTSEDFVELYPPPDDTGRVVWWGKTIMVFSALSAISQYFTNYAKGCEEGNAPVLSEEGAESAAKLLIMGQVVYWALTERSFVFDHIRENKMDRIVAEDAIEKNLPEGWIKHMRKYVKALYDGAKDDREKTFLLKFAELETMLKESNFKEAKKAWNFFYVTQCITKADKMKYKAFTKGKKDRTPPRAVVRNCQASDY